MNVDRASSNLPGDERFLVLAPTGRDGPLTCQLLTRAGMSAEVCHDLETLCVRMEREGAAGLLVAEEVLVGPGFTRLSKLLLHQEPWSDVPVLLFTGERALSLSRPQTMQIITPLGNVTLLDRPLRPITMVSAARAALRARRRQYATRSELERQKQAVQQRDQFLAMLGHELRNPLSAILMAAGAMAGSDGGRPRYLEILRRQAAHLARLVDDLLDVSRVTSGRIVLQKSPLDLGALINRCVQAIAPTAAQQQVTVSFTPPAEKARVDADPVRLEQVLSNLLNNAIKYTPAEGRVEVTLSRRGGEAVICVADTGVGIAREMLGRVFELFTQVESTLDRAKGGMGIGLTLVRSLVELHGGRVEAASEGIGKGCTFTVHLPLVNATDRATGPVANGNAREPGPAPEAMNILIVEDNPDSREVLKLVLEREGHQVAACADGLAGVECALERKPDLMVVDIGLPGLDGFGVARRVRATLARDVYLVALTGYGQPEDRRRALDAGFDTHLTKPVDVEVITQVLREVRK
jgi:signal transduction histidine kinase/CheY-like chemotaxis protein